MRSITSDDRIVYNGKARGNNESENGFYTFLFLIKCSCLYHYARIVSVVFIYFSSCSSSSLYSSNILRLSFALKIDGLIVFSILLLFHIWVWRLGGSLWMCCLELGIIRSLTFSSLRPVLSLSWIVHNFLICAGDVLCIPDWT